MSELDNPKDATTRDWFAGIAMQGLIMKWSLDPNQKTFHMGDYKQTAEMSYNFADAMLVAREETDD